MNKYDVVLSFCEGGAEGLQDRIFKHNDIPNSDWKFRAYNRVSYFEDIVAQFPDSLHGVDYMICPEKPWLIAHHIDEIYKRLGNGLCWINIQKGKYQEVGRGAEWGMERSQLYFQHQSCQQYPIEL